MSNEWETCTLGDVAEINPETVSGRDGSDLIRYIDIASVNSEYEIADLPLITLDKAPSRARRGIQTDDVLISNVRTERRSFCRIPDHLDGEVASTGFTVLRARDRLIEPGFLWGLVRDPLFVDYAVSRQSGTNYPAISATDVAQYQIKLPPVPEQRRIAWVLNSLDDKIEVNKRISRSLDEIAAAIFRARFIDFEGVEEFEKSELGPIPKGWKVATLGEEMELRYGRALSAQNRAEGNVPVYGSSGVVGCHDEALVDSPGIVVGRKGTVGTVNWVHRPFFPIDTTFYVEPIGSLPMSFLYFVLRASRLQDKGTDSAVPGLNRDNALSSLAVWPPSEEVERFCGLIEKFFDFRFALVEQATSLSSLRDELLPRLASGQVRVAEGVGPEFGAAEVGRAMVEA